MKTQAIQTKEILAWIVLVFAIALFSVTISFAQDNTKDKKSEIKIKIQKDENGKKTKIDTTITMDQLPAIKEYLKGLNIDFDTDEYGMELHNNANADHNITMHFRHPEMSEKEKAEFDAEMKKLNEEMDGLGDELKYLHLELKGLGEGDADNFDLDLDMNNLQMPPMPPMPPSVNGSFYFYGDDDGHCKDGKRYQFRFHSLNDEVPDSLNDDQHIVLYGAKGEETPSLEKEITTKDGGKIFIYKRNLPKQEEAKATASMPVTRLKVYPNPGNGKLSISFTSASKGDITISISDANGHEVYARTLEDFSGEYFNQVDISDKGKGTYYLKITQGDDSITKKLVVE